MLGWVAYGSRRPKLLLLSSLHLAWGDGGSAPCGRRHVAPDFNPGCEVRFSFSSPFRGAGADSLEEIVFVKFDSMFAQEGDELVLERHAFVMLLLTLDVRSHRRYLRLADREGAVPNLPSEPDSKLLAQPVGGVALDAFDHLRDGDGRR